jgi:hypothetical protein
MLAPHTVAAGIDDDVPSCLFEIDLIAITAIRTNDETANDSVDPKGEYFIGISSERGLGPFELRTGESSAFTPGLALDVIDSGWPVPTDGSRTVSTVAFAVMTREDDTTPVGEDDRDDSGTPLFIREQVVCPAGRTVVTRFVDIPHRSTDGRKRKADQLKLSLRIASID